MEESKKCWRKEVEENLKRLHSLLFGVDHALDNKDFSSAYVLALRLVGFLDSRCLSDVDETFIRPIRQEALAKLHSARQSLTPHSDRQAFEQAKKSPGCIFGTTGDIDIEKIQNSKYFRALLKQSKEKDGNQLVDQMGKQDKVGCKASKEMVQAKLTSMYGKSSLRTNDGSKSVFSLKNNSSEDCMIVEKPQSHARHTKGPGVSSLLQVEGEERNSENTFLTKRVHMENNSPRLNCAKSPSSKEEVNPDVCGNGFVTARAKLEMEAKKRQGVIGSPSASVSPQCDNNLANRLYGGRSYGVSRRGFRGNFVPPIKSNGNGAGNMSSRIAGKCDDALDDSTKRWSEVQPLNISLSSYLLLPICTNSQKHSLSTFQFPKSK